MEYRGLDALQPMTHVADTLYEDGFDVALRYLKNLTNEEIDNLRAGGIAVGFIFEEGTNNAFNGASQGTKDGNTAKSQAQGFGVPDGTVIFMTVDKDLDSHSIESQLDTIEEYLDAFTVAIAPYEPGIYACGTVLDRLDHKAIPWLAGAMGWSGSKDYEASNEWMIWQGLPSDGCTWAGETWPPIGFDYDPNVATSIDWAWAPSIRPRPRLPVLQIGDTGMAVGELQIALNAHPISVDYAFGATTDYAVRAFQNAKGLTVDGIVGPDTWKALFEDDYC